MFTNLNSFKDFSSLKILLFSAAFILSCVQPALAKKLEKIAAPLAYSYGVMLFDQGLYAQSIMELTTVAVPGAPWLYPPEKKPWNAPGFATNATCLLGNMYALGLGTPSDIRTAGRWWFPPEKRHDALLDAAEKGDIGSQILLGDLYLSLPCGGENPNEKRHTIRYKPIATRMALDWYMKASDAGNITATLKAAKISHAMVALTTKEQEAVVDLYRKVAEAGVAEGQYHYGRALRNGERYAEGLRWIRKADAGGFEPATEYLEKIWPRSLGWDRTYEKKVMAVIVAFSVLALYLVRKKKTMRACLTRSTAIGIALYIGILLVVFKVLSRMRVLSLSTLDDRLYQFMLQSKVYLPDALADNIYIVSLLDSLLIVAFLLAIDLLRNIFSGPAPHATNNKSSATKAEKNSKTE